MIQTIREWFFRLFFGVKLDEFILGNIEASMLRDDVRELQEAYTNLLIEWNKLNTNYKVMHEEIRDMQQAMIIMNQNTGDLTSAIQDNRGAIKHLTELGSIHNKTLDHIISKMKPQEVQITSTPNSDKLN